MTHILFDPEQIRTDASPAKHGEAWFHHMNRSSHPVIKRIREFVEIMLSEYPQADVQNLVKRIKLSNLDQAQSALFELLIHHMLIISGYKIIELEPNISGSTKQPDFLVESPVHQRFYLECLRIADGPQEERGGKRNQDIFRDALNSIESKYYLDLKVTGLPKQTPSRKQFCKAVRHWLKSIDENNPENTKPLIWSAQGMTFRVALLRPITPKSDPTFRSVGVEFGGLTTLSPDGGVKAPLRQKMRRYGKPDLPLIIAFTAPSFFLDETEIYAALFGDEALSINQSTGTATPCRDNNGLWGHNPWHYKQCSGVLYFKNLIPSRASVRKGKFIHHPSPNNPIDIVHLPVTELKVMESGALDTVKQGIPLGELFMLSAKWPEDETKL